MSRTVVLISVGRISSAEAASVVFNSNFQPTIRQSDGQIDRGATGAPRSVVDSFFEDQEEVTPLLGSQLNFLRLGWSLKLPGNASGFKEVGHRLPDARQKAGEIISPRIDRPHDIAQRISEPSGHRRHLAGHGKGFRIGAANLLLHGFTQESHAREARPDVVMQVRGNARAHALEFEKPFHAVAIERVHRRGYKYGEKALKPPAAPDGRQNSEIHLSHVGAHPAFPVDRTHQEAIGSRREGGIVYGSLLADLAPIPVSTFQLVLVAEYIADAEVEARKFNLDLVLIWSEHQTGESAFS